MKEMPSNTASVTARSSVFLSLVFVNVDDGVRAHLSNPENRPSYITFCNLDGEDNWNSVMEISRTFFYNCCPRENAVNGLIFSPSYLFGRSESGANRDHRQLPLLLYT